MEKMKAYDIRCPVCGTVNYSLFLQETDGLMECENCGTVSRVLALKPVKVALVNPPEQYSVCGRPAAANL